MTSYNLPRSVKPSHVVLKGQRFLFPVLGILFLSSLEFTGVALAKTPGKTYCYKKTCHRVKTLNETKALVGRDLKINASYYDGCSKDRFNSCGLTSSGEIFKPHRADNAASSILPDGTIALIWSEVSGEAIVLRINNAGPYWGNRKLDLSAAAARKLGMKGVEEVTLRVVKAPTEDEARFEKNRSYDPVIGPLGKFASLELAQKAMSKIRSDGLKSSPSLASLQETLPTSGPEIKIASLDETTTSLSSVAFVNEQGLQPNTSTLGGDAQTMMPSKSFLSSLSRVKDFLANFNPQLLFLDAEQNFIEPNSSKYSTVPVLQTVEVAEIFDDLLASESASHKNIRLQRGLQKIASPETSSSSSGKSPPIDVRFVKASRSENSSDTSSASAKDSRKISSSTQVTRKNQVNLLANGKTSFSPPKSAGRQIRQNVKIVSLVSGSGEKYSSQKSKKKAS